MLIPSEGSEEDSGGSQNLVEIHDLTRRFGAKVALNHVSFTVPSGIVLGLVGENGAGKTTLIKHLLGLYRAQNGTVRVFGRDPVADPVYVLSRIGYLSEEDTLPGWMRVHELFRYAQAFYPTWDEAYAEDLRREFGLDLRAKVGNLSKGQRARAGLILALAYRPPLLVLDEPSSGLDPVVRRDILAAIIRTIADEGRTVLFSSHLLEEVERVSDRVAMMVSGRIIFCDALDAIKERHHRITLRFDVPRAQAPTMPGAFGWRGQGREWTALWNGSPELLEAGAAILGAQIVEQSGTSLDEIFVARVGATGGAGED
ncbi:MAG: ABC transporter ATP-binding protein [Armatimonadetes bacterium]|nr:ABC transporter ATP-binding protein [Armatimonadota bacterium]